MLSREIRPWMDYLMYFNLGLLVVLVFLAAVDNLEKHDRED